jgi:CRISPR-associated exonuclease Cas4
MAGTYFLSKTKLVNVRIEIMQITGTHFNYFRICHRKLWLFAHSIQMEHTSDLVTEGRLIHENSYQQRTSRYEEIEVDGIKIDYFDARNRVVHEVKKSDKMEDAHVWQLKYYLYVMERRLGETVTGILEYPKLRRTVEVLLSEPDRAEIEAVIIEINKIIQSDICPEKAKMSICRNCSYYDFCWVAEGEKNELSL